MDSNGPCGIEHPSAAFRPHLEGIAIYFVPFALSLKALCVSQREEIQKKIPDVVSDDGRKTDTSREQRHLVGPSVV